MFKAQYVLCTGIFFSESIEKSGIDILNREIKKQMDADSGQYELDLGYHSGCISIFSEAFNMAKQNGYNDEFPDSFISTIKKMMRFAMNTYFPDYTFPCFNDARSAKPFNLVQSSNASPNSSPKTISYIILPSGTMKVSNLHNSVMLRPTPAFLLSVMDGNKMLP
ncbi:putative uncharacterized protein [Bacteroides clarus CAG:160]|nr:putative uncharacterized protein [Bacteroides clarus CAG:160]